MVKHIQTIRRQIADELFECVWPFCGVDAYFCSEKCTFSLIFKTIARACCHRKRARRRE